MLETGSDFRLRYEKEGQDDSQGGYNSNRHKDESTLIKSI